MREKSRVESGGVGSLHSRGTEMRRQNVSLFPQPPVLQGQVRTNAERWLGNARHTLSYRAGKTIPFAQQGHFHGNKNVKGEREKAAEKTPFCSPLNLQPLR